ncbi:MAG: Phosphoribosylformylglycinamidine synthase, PurS subunit (EC [uncultured Campylobacterales bacterium]|uniref:Phosphoribosylformylglycinamidine synthase subunit PurS n=1 Tax=uncultured Campylobacterales bacterium TaxID=352960 RepID=A0A6S6SQS3_9BACT|nr:MAG: Phosphoribosylformylglycinamidine synthase, PurS subunit (EC [uncultured Campylobacterales bacterium]
MKVVVNIKLKDGVLDPQGKASLHALSSIGFDNVLDARIGKQIVLELEENDKVKAKQSVTKMCEELLANTVIEDYDIEL